MSYEIEGQVDSPLDSSHAFMAATDDEIISALTASIIDSDSGLSGYKEKIRDVIPTDGFLQDEDRSGGRIFVRENVAYTVGTEVKSVLSSLGYEGCSPEAQEILFSTIATGLLADSGCNPTSRPLDRFGYGTPFTHHSHPVPLPGRKRAVTKRTPFGMDESRPTYLHGVTYDVVVDFTDLIETSAIDEIAEKFGTNIVELDDGEGRTEVHMQTSFGHNFVHITHPDGSVALLAYRQDQDDDNVLFDTLPDQLRINLDDIVSSGEDGVPLTVDWDSIVVDRPQPEVTPQEEDYWSHLRKRLTLDLDLIRFAASLPVGSVIETDKDQAIQALTAAAELVDSSGKIKPRMSDMPPLVERISQATCGATLPSKEQFGVEKHWGTFDKHRILLLEPNTAAVIGDMAKTKQWQDYDPESILSLYIGLPLKHSGKGVVGMATTRETTYLRFKDTDWGTSKRARRASERRTVLKKSNRKKDGEAVLNEIQQDSATVAITLEQAGLRHPILAGLPSLGKRR